MGLLERREGRKHGRHAVDVVLDGNVVAEGESCDELRAAAFRSAMDVADSLDVPRLDVHRLDFRRAVQRGIEERMHDVCECKVRRSDG